MMDTWIPYGGGEQAPNRIVVHSMGEFIKDGQDFLHAPAFLNEYKLSAHILVDHNGRVFQCRKDNEQAWHARGYNKDSLGIEFLVKGRHDYASFVKTIQEDYVTDVQFEAGLDIVRSWCEKYDIKNIDRHSDLSPGRKVDPGTGFNWIKFKDEL